MASAGKRLTSFCMAALMLLTILPITADAVSVEWSGTFNCHENNNVTTTLLPYDPTSLEQSWCSPTGNNTIVIVDDAIYTYNGINPELWASYEDGGTFYKLDADTGEVLQSVSCDYGTTFYYSYSIYANGLICVGCPTVILAFDPETCELVWETPVTERYYSTLQYINGCIVSNGTVLNADTGKVIAEIDGKWGGGWSNGVEIGDCFYIADATESLLVVDTNTWTVADTLDSGLSAGTSCPGVVYYQGCLYWGGINGNFYRAEIGEDGLLNESAWKTTVSGIKCYGTPVAANDRVYLAGMTTNTATTNTGTIAICVFSADTAEMIYMTNSDVTGKIQSTPLLCDAGSSVRVYVQGYKKPGIVYFLEDTPTQTGGSLTDLIVPDKSQYSWEQLACDAEGAIYCSNDAGYLMKYQNKLVKGDANGDGQLDLQDAALLSQYLAGWNVEIRQETTDVNGDGSITIGDVAQIRRYLAGWDVSLFR